MEFPFKFAIVIGLLFGTVFTLGIYNDINDYTNQQTSEVHQ